MPDDPRGPNPVKLKKPFRVGDECLWHVRQELFKNIEMFMDHLDFGLFPWDTNNSEVGGSKGEVYVQDMNILRRMYKLKSIYERQKMAQPNSNNWNFGSIPKHLLKKQD